MNKLFSVLAATVLAAGFAAPSQAATVSFTGSLGIVIAGLPALPVPGSGVATINGSGGASKPITHISLPGSVFSTSVTIPLPNVFPIVGLAITATGPAAVFSAGQTACGTSHALVTCSDDSVLHGRAGVVGSAFVGLFNSASAPVANLSVPLGVAGAGSTASVSSIGITLMLTGAGWTTGTVTVIDGASVPTGTITVMGGQTTNTAGTGNEITLVSPLQIFTNATGGFLPSFVTWRINLLGTKGGGTPTPEPGMLLLLGSGVVGLAICGRRKMKR